MIRINALFPHGGHRPLACCFGRRARNRSGAWFLSVPASHQQRLSPDEIRRDAGFDGRDARATGQNDGANVNLNGHRMPLP
jgi:hypothetical protein